MDAMTGSEHLLVGRRVRAASALFAVVALFGMHGLATTCLDDTMPGSSSDMTSLTSMGTSVAAMNVVGATHRATSPTGGTTHPAAMCLVVLAGLSLVVALLRGRTVLRSLPSPLRRALPRDHADRGPPDLHQLAVLRL